jgi:predicted ATP-dependent endonuclease of OLD family
VQSGLVLLKSVQVRLFRNIVDSGVVTIENDVTCLVGKNESGKTALLSALYRFNPAYEEARFDLQKDYPRWRLVKDRRNGAVEDVQPITCLFDLDGDDRAAVETAMGPGVLTGNAYQRSLSYAGKATCLLSVDSEAARNNLYASLNTPEALKNAIGDVTDLADVLAAAKALASPDEEAGFTASDVQAVLAGATERLAGKTSTWLRVESILQSRLPKFFYFGEYQTLPGRIDVRQLGGEEKPGATAIQTARSLLNLADTNADALTDEDFEDRKAELEAVSNELTEEVFKYWTQNRELSVEIDLDKVTEQNPYGQSAVARFLEVRVKDRRHGFTNNFGQRSSGFQWFFSFLAAFSEFENYKYGVVVLLDEPALTLHGRAQADFLRFIDERLAPEAQVLFTTHSPFMVEPAKLSRVRIVEDRGPSEGSVVTDEALAVGDDSLFPLEAALGYDIAQNLFVGSDNLLVEGTSDYAYLTLISDRLNELGRTHLDDRWRVLPAGGATNIPTFVALIGRSLQVTVLIDGSPSGVTKLQNLAARGLLTSKRLLLTDSFTDNVAPSDIEDLFSVGDYLKLYNAAFGTSLKVAGLNGTDRVIARISRATGTPFTDHGKPADALLRQRDKFLPALSEATLARFERLFDAINNTLA